MEKNQQKTKKNNENVKIIKKMMVKYRCEECQGLLFTATQRIPKPVTIEIVCKTKHFINKSSRNKVRCNHLNIIKGSHNV